MAWRRRRLGAVIGGFAVGVLGLACAEGGGRTTEGSSPTGTEGGTTDGITTFQPTTSIDPSDPTLTGTDDSGPATGSSDAETSLDGTTSAGPDDSSSSDGSSGGDAAPSVQSTSPAELMSGVPADTAIEIEFSEPMDPATITTDIGGRCSGSVQVSADAFVTCVAMTGTPATGDDQSFTVTPAAPLSSATPYQIRVLASATDAAGTPMAADFTTATGFIVRYFHSVVIDGVDDFDAVETLPTSTMGHTARVAWDDAYLYLGMLSPDVATGSDQVWLVAYVGGPAGTSQGATYNTQSPALPFDARWHLRWRTDGGFWGAQEWTGAVWQDDAFVIPPGDVASSGDFVELRVPWTELGDPAYLDLHLGLLREESFNEWSWAAVPEASYVEGYDPDYAQFFQFDLAGSTTPADTPPM